MADRGRAYAARPGVRLGYPTLRLRGEDNATVRSWRGAAGPDGTVDQALTDTLLSAIAIRMHGNHRPTGAPSAENSSIPAGYTYLGQFAAHDLTANSEMEIGHFSGAEPANLRNRALKLDALYGAGPAISAPCYQYARGFGQTSPRLRLDRVGKETDGPRRDIGRLVEREGCGHAGRALVADARSDDNAVIAQLTALFSHAHNAIVDRIAGHHGQESPTELFRLARLAMQDLWRGVLAHDYLSRILHPETHAWYVDAGRRPRFVSVRPAGSPATREFAHAAFRMGHAMVRPTYRFNTRSDAHPIQRVVTRTSRGEPHETPLDRKWIAEWSRFFAIAGHEGPGRPQASMRIAPGYASAFNDSFRHPTRTHPESLAQIDLLRAAVGGVRSLGGLRDGLVAAPKSYPGLEAMRDRAAHRAMVRAWLDTPPPPSGYGGVFPPPMPGPVAESLVDDTPLGLFVLIEAATLAAGSHLGPLGSMIVAETFFQAMHDMPRSAEDRADTATALAAAFPDGMPRTMPELVLWVDGTMSVSDKTLPDGEMLPLV